MSFSGSLEDRLAIREHMDSYADCAFRGDVKGWLSHWAEDGVWFVAGSEKRGKEALRHAWEQLWSQLDRMAFFNQIGAIEVEGDRARARCYCREIVRMKTGEVWKVVGAYADELVRTEGRWLFARRDYQLFLDER